jgi:hypothetical protein
MINSKPGNAVKDIAAQVTLVSYVFLENLKPIFQKETILKGAEKNYTVEAKVPENVALRIGPVIQRWDVVVGEIADSLLHDFMRMHMGIVNMIDMMLTLNLPTVHTTKIKIFSQVEYIGPRENNPCIFNRT